MLDYVAKDESKSTTEGLPLPTQVAVNVLSMPVVVVLIIGNIVVLGSSLSQVRNSRYSCTSVQVLN